MKKNGKENTIVGLKLNRPVRRREMKQKGKTGIMNFYIKNGRNMELHYIVDCDQPLTRKKIKELKENLRITGREKIYPQTRLKGGVVEVGTFPQNITPFCTQAKKLLHSCGLPEISRIEVMRRIKIPRAKSQKAFIIYLSETGFYDPMREQVYEKPLQSFVIEINPKPIVIVPVLGDPQLMAEANKKYNMGFDQLYQDHFYNLFQNQLMRNPTDAELAQIREMCSNHSMHSLFNAAIIIGEKQIPHTLMELVKKPWEANPHNSVIAFHDNASAIRGAEAMVLQPVNPGRPGRMDYLKVLLHISLTVETHNYPTLWCPWPGAETGIGGCLRDDLAKGRGGDHRYAIAGFFIGNLFIPGYIMLWEKRARCLDFGAMAPPLQICKDAPWGTWSYGNRYGVPTVQGVFRTFGMDLPNGEHYEFVKPIMMAGLHGVVREEHTVKEKPTKGFKIIGFGGFGYRVGVGGGSGSSEINDEADVQRDFNAVQRGDALVAQLTWRVIRACCELGIRNPIAVIHDQGAAGCCGVLTELVGQAGGKINVRKVKLGDSTLSNLEIWIAEYQERYGILVYEDQVKVFIDICDREECSYEILGEVTGDGRIVVYDGTEDNAFIDLPIREIREGLPQKIIRDIEPAHLGGPVKIPEGLSFCKALEWVMRIPSVCSKEFLVNRVDHSVGGLIVQNQRCGALHLPVSDMAIASLDYVGHQGSTTAVGECSPKMMLNPRAGARMAVAEMRTNMAGVLISDLRDVKASVNWMWAAKNIPGGVAKMYYAMEALSEDMIKTQIACDGGKDSDSLAVKLKNELIKSPETLVVTGYAFVPDVRKRATPDIKRPGRSVLLYIDFGGGKYRLGGSAFLQTLNQLGDECPDIEDRLMFNKTLEAIQDLLRKGLLLSLHDRSDGGLAVMILEMLFAGNCGADIVLPGKVNVLNKMFAEEAGLVMEVLFYDLERVYSLLFDAGIEFAIIGNTQKEKLVSITYNNQLILCENTDDLRHVWQETSYRIDRLQVNSKTADEERRNTAVLEPVSYKLTFTPQPTPATLLMRRDKPRVAVVRNIGTNGDREMIAALVEVGFEVWDVHTGDFIKGKVSLDKFVALIFAGGFSFGDVFVAGRGWAKQFIKNLLNDLLRFKQRPNSWFLGVCNGCQAGAHMGMAPFGEYDKRKQPLFLENESRAFESRPVAVKILYSPSILFKDMAGSIMPVYVAHREGKMWFPDKASIDFIGANNLVTMAFVDETGEPTTKYPFNPNGSINGWTGICDLSGRFNLMMPHPERVFRKCQLPYLTDEQDWEWETSPWLKMFQNARE